MATKQTPFLLVLVTVIVSACLIFAMFSCLQPAYATTAWSVTVKRWDTPNSLTTPTNSPTQTLLVDDIGDLANSSLQVVSGYGGFYQQNRNQTAYANFTGVPVSYFASLIGINTNYEVIIRGVGSNEFDYNIIMNNQADANSTWDSNQTEYAPPKTTSASYSPTSQTANQSTPIWVTRKRSEPSP